MSVTELREAKRHLRAAVLGRRDAMSAGHREAMGGAILREVAALSEYRRANAIMAYAGIGSELQTDEFLRHVLGDGKALLLPRVNREKKLLEVYEVRDTARDLAAGTWGIREPAPDLCPLADLGAVDFVLVPGVAFDPAGGRLGYGAGFYDGLLSGTLSSHARLVAGAFETQVVEKVPREEHDVPIHLVITEARHYLPEPFER